MNKPKLSIKDGRGSAIADGASPRQPQEWPEPLLFGETEESTLPEITADLLQADDPGAVIGLDKIASAVSDFSQTPPALAVMFVLAAVAACCQRKFEVHPWAGYRETLSLWVMVTLPASTRKTSVFEFLTRPHLAWQERQKESLRIPIERSKTERKITQAKIADLESKAKDAKSQDEVSQLLDQIDTLRIEEQKEMHSPEVFFGNCTPEAFESHLAIHGAGALLADEGGQLDIMAGIYSQGTPNVDCFLRSYTGTSIQVKRRQREAFIVRPASTIGLITQTGKVSGLHPSAKRKFRDNGIFSRFLWCLPKSTVGTRDVRKHSKIPLEIEDGYQQRIWLLLEVLAGPEARIVGVEPDALEEWYRLAEFIEPKQAKGQEFESYQDVTGKIPGQALRIAGLLACWETANLAGAININADQMRRASKLCRLLIPHAQKMLDGITSDPCVDDARYVFEHITAQRANPVVVRELHALGRFKNGKKERLSDALNVLWERNIVGPERTISTGGRPKVVRDINPAVLEPERKLLDFSPAPKANLFKTKEKK